jgi:hypothetical protein
MLTIFQSKTNKYCDGVSRRSFLKVGAMGMGAAGLSLSDLLRLEAQAAATPGASPVTKKSLINIYLGGGPSHTDIFDLKPDAPSEFRGEFNPISTNVPGMQICELMPRLAKSADKFAVIRSVVGTYPDHSNVHTLSGYDEKDLKAVGGHPPLGSVVAKLQGGRNSAPPFVSLMGPVSAGFVGPLFQPFRPDGPGRANLSLTRIPADRVRDRSKLLSDLDDLKRDIDASGAMEAMDSFQQRAVEVVTSGRLADALDLQKEDPATRARYQAGSTSGRMGDTDNLLLARRLVEAGARVVTTQWGGWDTHSDNFKTLRRQLPALDAALAALIQDLQDRGMLDDTTIVMWGEFGRSPRISTSNGGGPGRDHWPRVMGAFLAGGGMKTGQMIGSTDRYGGEAIDRPVHLREIFATLYHNMGINAKATSIIDPAGRPQYLVDGYDPVRELVRA